ncbi:hypothetical protein ZOSMA_346G00020 [Zostera marina]|uniref:TF-B3 domain-containing protein n=1 Tax=Zostera marina TaxID=29655 RepID=A0A0K9P773_ZOSMR|nr:hypothetical protein ZOSMA_346G00020 [Zostera marina]
MYGKGWCLFVEKNCLMKDMVFEFLYYPSIRRSLIVQITRYCVPASFIEGTVRKPIKVPAFFSRPRPTTLREKTEFKVESVNEESSDNEPDNENTGEEDVVVSDQQGEHAAEDEFHQDMEWTARLSKSHVLGGNPYMTGWRHFVKELELEVGDLCVFKILFKFVPDNIPVIKMAWINLGLNE